MPDGRRIAIAVKPREKAERRDLECFLRRISRQIPRSFTTPCRHDHGGRPSRDLFRDARLIYGVRSAHAPEDHAIVMGIVAALEGAVTVGGLVKASGLAGRGFRAIVHLIADGTLNVPGTRPFDDPTLVARPGITKRVEAP